MKSNLAIKAEDVEQDATIASDTFKPTGRKLGAGCWGSVDEYKDIAGHRWAIKTFEPNETARAQMAERGWTEERVMRSEAIPLDAAKDHVVPRIIERDRNGKLYVAMPVYEKTLQDCKEHYTMGNGENPQEDILRVLKDVAQATARLHRGRGDRFLFRDSPEDEAERAHGDIKPSNIFMQGGEAFLSDLGSSTCISIGGSGNVRGTHGDINYRAPECFKTNASPSRQADIWSLGAIAYKLSTGQNIYEGINPNEASSEQLKQHVSKKLKLAKRSMRPFLKKCLSVEPKQRYSDGSEALKDLEKMLGDNSIWTGIRKTFGWSLPAFGAAALASLLTYANATYEPKQLNMPQIYPKNQSPGMLYLNQKDDSELVFESENIRDLPRIAPVTGMMTEGIEKRAKQSTNNRVVAYLSKAGAFAYWSGYRGLVSRGHLESTTDEQQAIYDEYTDIESRKSDIARGPVYPVVAKSIEFALTKSINENKKIDLEDTVAIARLGEEKIKLAKQLTGSNDFGTYRFARLADGTDLIPQKEREYVGLWIYYAKHDVDLLDKQEDLPY